MMNRAIINSIMKSKPLCGFIKQNAVVTTSLFQFPNPKPELFHFKTRFTSNLSETSSISHDSGDSKIRDQPSIDILAKDIAQHDMPIEMENPYQREKKVCILCKYGVHLDYKNPKLLSQFVSPFTGQIYGRQVTRLCARQQKLLENQIKKSREAGFMAVMIKSVEFLKDPQLCDPNNPIRPHKY